MKRKSTLILIAALVLAVTIPVFAMAAGGARNADNAGTMNNGRYLGQLNADGTSLRGNQFAMGDYLVDEDGYCYALDENGDQQRLYARGANGQAMYLRFSDGEYCWSNEYVNQNNAQTRTDNAFGGRGCPRWN